MTVQPNERYIAWYLFLGLIAFAGWSGSSTRLKNITSSGVKEVRPLESEWYRQFRHVGMDSYPYRSEGGRPDELATFFFRYKRSLDLLRSLYEKILALDHHFSSLETHQHILSLSNPLSYPEFERTREVIRQRMKKQFRLKLPDMLDSNPYLSTTFAMVGSLLGSGKHSEREADLESIACILDFTMKMHADLHVIYFETEYLKDANASIMKRAEELFEKSASVVGYSKTLRHCRSEDDWESLYQRIEAYQQVIGRKGIEELNDRLADLEFAVNRIIEFTHVYTQFVDQGNKYYRKFERIVGNFENEPQCTDQLPANFALLKREISQSLQKFNTAYNMSELEGSRLKELLYGTR